MSFQAHREILLAFLEVASRVRGTGLAGIYQGLLREAPLSSALECGEQSYHLFRGPEGQVPLPYTAGLYLALWDRLAQTAFLSPRKPGEHMGLHGKPWSFWQRSRHSLSRDPGLASPGHLLVHTPVRKRGSFCVLWAGGQPWGRFWYLFQKTRCHQNMSGGPEAIKTDWSIGKKTEGRILLSLGRKGN